jgi:hypothetical protein
MDGDKDHLARLLAICVAVLVLVSVCTFRYLPREFGMFLVSWVMLSISVGISFGHCVLNEP